LHLIPEHAASKTFRAAYLMRAICFIPKPDREPLSSLKRGKVLVVCAGGGGETKDVPHPSWVGVVTFGDGVRRLRLLLGFQDVLHRQCMMFALVLCLFCQKIPRGRQVAAPLSASTARDFPCCRRTPLPTCRHQHSSGPPLRSSGTAQMRPPCHRQSSRHYFDGAIDQ
jgi:hypothetical protein